jgi:hypothetical protein
MAKRTGLSGKSERTELSAERLDLIHRFMSERPEDEREVPVEAAARTVRDEPPAPAAAPAPDLPPAPAPSSPTPSLARVRQLAPPFRMPQLGEMRRRRPQVAVLSMRNHGELAWLVVALILALLVGVLIAH